MKKFLIIADDFTGSNDTGVQLTKRGVNTRVFFKYMKNDGNSSYVIDTETRNVSKDAAYSKIHETIKYIDFHHYDYVIKKIDSTLRGNISEEVKAIDEKFKSELIIFMPALPDLNRTTINGIHCLNNVRISQTEIANDPIKPVTEDNIVNILKDTFPDENVEALTIENLREGQFDFNTSRVWAVDALLNKDMQLVIMKALATNKRILWIGSAGIADNIMALEYKTAPSLALVGSLSETTRKQLKYAEKKDIQLLSVPIYDVLLKKNSEQYVEEASKLLSEKKDVIIMSSASYDREELEKTIQICKEHNLNKEDINATVQGILGDITEKVIRNNEISGIFLTGGETAIGFLDKIECSGVEIIEEIITGIPLMKICDGPFNQLKLITKAGAFGNEDALYFSMKKLKEIDSK